MSCFIDVLLIAIESVDKYYTYKASIFFLLRNLR